MDARKRERKSFELLLENAKELYANGRLEIESQEDHLARFEIDGVSVRISPIRGARFEIGVQTDGVTYSIEAGDVGNNFYIPWPSKLKRLAGYLYSHRQASAESRYVCEAITKVVLKGSS